MFAFGYEPQTMQTVTTSGTAIVPLRAAGCSSYEFDPTFPNALQHHMPAPAFQAVIQRCNMHLRSVFHRYRGWLAFYVFYIMFMVLWLSDAFDDDDDDAYDDNTTWWWWWIIIWVCITPLHSYMYRRSAMLAVQRIQAELAGASAQFPGTNWRLISRVYNRRALARHMHIEIDMTGSVTTVTPGAPGAPAYAAGGYTPAYGQPGAAPAPGGYGTGVPPPAPGYGATAQGYSAPPVQYGVAQGGYAPVGGGASAVPPPTSGGYV